MPFEPGDMLAHYGRCGTSRLISLATFDASRLRPGPSHVSIVCGYAGPEHVGPLLVESTTLSSKPCVIQQRRVRGVQAHDPYERVRAYAGRVDLYRLVPMWKLSRAESRLLTRILIEHFVRPGIRYDTGGALLSGTRVFKWTRLFPAAALEFAFCSELASAVEMRLGRLRINNPGRFTPAALIRELTQTGVYRCLGDARKELP